MRDILHSRIAGVASRAKTPKNRGCAKTSPTSDRQFIPAASVLSPPLSSPGAFDRKAFSNSSNDNGSSSSKVTSLSVDDKKPAGRFFDGTAQLLRRVLPGGLGRPSDLLIREKQEQRPSCARKAPWLLYLLQPARQEVFGSPLQSAHGRTGCGAENRR